MKKSVVSILVLVLMCRSTLSCGQTPVSGGIFANTTWTLANSPYLVTGNIVVFPGVTLTIEPGVEVRIEDDASLAPGLYLEARGTIHMVGQPGLPIRVHADSAVEMVGAWQGFRVNNAQGGAIDFDYVEVSNANSTFSYTGTPPQNVTLHGCVFNFNYYGIESALSLTLDNCSFHGNNSAVAGWSIFDITHCVFDSNGAALPVYASSLTVDSCSFSRNQTAINLNSIPFTGMSISNSIFNDNGAAINNPGNGTITNCGFVSNFNGITGSINAQITDCNFNGNHSAVQLGFGSTISNCDINNNTIGVGLGPLSFGQPTPTIQNNRICQNDSFNVQNNTDLNLFLATNCFCESDSSLIEQKILDGYDDITRGLISYAIYDTTCSTLVRLIDKTDPTGVQRPEINVFKIFPNPTGDFITIDRVIDGSMVMISDPSGNNVRSYSVDATNKTIDVSGLPAGLYLITVTDSTRKRMARFVRQ